MEAYLRDRWADALCSGKYSQGFDQLGCITDEGVKEYCCLGVLVEVARVELEAAGISVAWVGNDLAVGKEQQIMLLPSESLQVLGVENCSVPLRLPCGDQVLSDSLNDLLSLTFSQIADVVRCSA